MGLPKHSHSYGYSKYVPPERRGRGDGNSGPEAQSGHSQPKKSSQPAGPRPIDPRPVLASDPSTEPKAAGHYRSCADIAGMQGLILDCAVASFPHVVDRRYGPVRDNFTVIVIPIYDRKQMPVGKVQFQAVLAYRERRLNKSLELASSSVENEVHQAVMNLMLALGDSIDEVELMARYDEDNPYRPGYSYFNHGEPNPDSSRVASFERKEGFNHKDGRDHPAPRQTPSGYKEWPQQAQDHGDSGQDYNQYHQGRQPVGSGGKHREQMYFKGGRYAKPVV